ncbi:MAG: hypothetical protein FWE61_02555 [Micrococcales bacterium]|nr:hypothetical protein [Micrococcales bacterium]
MPSCRCSAAHGNQLSPERVRFGLSLIPSDLSSGAAGFGGHVVTTGIVAATVGLGVVVWRAARARGPADWAVRYVAVGVPVVALVSVLEVPVQSTAVPEHVLKLAQRLDVMIRDTSGLVHGL